MKLEVSRRRFLKRSVALSVLSSSAIYPTKVFSSKEVNKTDENQIKKVPTLCEMCVNKCAAIAIVKDGIVKKLNPNPYFPKSKNMLCARGQAGIHALYDPDRLKYPLIRTGKRGSAEFKKVTWDEAWTYIKDKLVKILDEEKDNRSCIGFCAGEGMGEHTFKDFLSYKIGSSNFVNHSSICLQTAVLGYAITIGGYGFADLENAKYAILAGANRAEAIMTPDSIDMFKRTRKRGLKLVVLDPRFTNTALHADTYLAIKPGSDLAFVLALTYVVMDEELYDKKFVENNVNDFRKYKNHILSNNYTPKWASKITGIPESDIYEVAREFMANAPMAVYYQGRRSTFAKNDFQLRRAQAIFTALGGGIDVKGGIVFGETLPLGKHNITMPMYANAKPRIEKNAANQILATGSWVAWRNLILENKAPYPIRAMFIYKQNPVLSVPSSQKTIDMFNKLSLIVAIDTMPSDTAILADVILPECTYLERTDSIKSFAGTMPAIALRQQVIKPMYDTKPVFEILEGLAKKISKPLWQITKKYDEDVKMAIEDGEDEEELYLHEGYDLTDMFKHSVEQTNKHIFLEKYSTKDYQTLLEKGVFYPNMNEYFKKINANEYEYYPENKKFYSSLKLKEDYDIKKYIHNDVKNIKEISSLKKEFHTGSKKVECYLKNYENSPIDTMPTWRDEDYKKIPKTKFKYISGRHAQFTQNSTANNMILLELMPTNYIWINDKDAKSLNIKFGDLLEVKTNAGSVKIKAFPTPKILPQIVFYAHGFGSKSSGLSFAFNNGASDNEIIEDRIEPAFGSSIMHDSIVSIRKV